jgi:hypothetical protein
MLLLSGGMVLVIPTLIAMLSATAYEPPANYVQDQAPSDEPIANPPETEGAAAPGKQAPRVAATSKKGSPHRSRTLTLVAPQPEPSLVGLSSDGFSLSVPSVVATNIYTKRELALYRVEQGTELRMPVLNWVF